MGAQKSNSSDESEYIQKFGSTTAVEAEAKRDMEKTLKLIERMKAGTEKMYTHEEMMRRAEKM